MSISNQVYTNPAAATFNLSPQSPSSATAATVIRTFHQNLPQFMRTPLISVPQLSAKLNLKAVFIKSESSRAGLPAFKVLGASWGAFRAVCDKLSLSLDSTLEEAGTAARQANLVLFAATEGNHGRAVARMGKLLGVQVRIFVPDHMYLATREKITGEGAQLVVVAGDYDASVAKAWEASRAVPDAEGILVQDNSFDKYEQVPAWIVEGYSTLLEEAQEQVIEAGFDSGMTHVVTPIGVGSLGHAVVNFAKRTTPKVTVVAVEPDSAACLYRSLQNGKHTVIRTNDTIMSGMCCGTVSPISWPALRDGVDISTTVSDVECHHMISWLQEKFDIDAGPCGAGALSGFLKVVNDSTTRNFFGPESVVVILSTEGPRSYPVPSETSH